MAPLTRFRTDEEGVHHEIAVEMYAQRAEEGTLIISEGMTVSLASGGYPGPGIYTQEQIDAWKKVGLMLRPC